MTSRLGLSRRASALAQDAPFGIGGLRLSELTALDIEDMLDDVGRAGLSRSSLAGIRNALAALLTDAVRGRVLATNVARSAELPDNAPRTREVEPPSVEQVAALLDASEGTSIERLLVTLAMTGCRIGEALAMQWGDVDLDVGTWRVQRTTTLRRDGGVTLGVRTKTGDGRRVVLSPELVVSLRAQRRDVAAMQLACPIWQDNDLIFPTTVGTPQHSQNVRTVVRPIAASVNYPGSFHSLRHFVASVALASVPLPLASKLLGHRKSALTVDLYSHMLASEAGRIATLITDTVREARK